MSKKDILESWQLATDNEMLELSKDQLIAIIRVQTQKIRRIEAENQDMFWDLDKQSKWSKE